MRSYASQDDMASDARLRNSIAGYATLRWMFARAVKAVPSPEDAVQEAYVYLLERWPDDVGKRTPAWCISTMRWRVHEIFRRSRALTVPVDGLEQQPLQLLSGPMTEATVLEPPAPVARASSLDRLLCYCVKGLEFPVRDLARALECDAALLGRAWKAAWRRVRIGRSVQDEVLPPELFVGVGVGGAGLGLVGADDRAAASALFEAGALVVGSDCRVAPAVPAELPAAARLLRPDEILERSLMRRREVAACWSGEQPDV